MIKYYKFYNNTIDKCVVEWDVKFRSLEDVLALARNKIDFLVWENNHVWSLLKFVNEALQWTFRKSSFVETMSPISSPWFQWEKIL